MSKQSAARRLVGRWTGKLLAIGVLWGASALVAAAQGPTPAQILAINPKCEDVSISKPAPADIAGCKLEVVKTPGGGSGFVLTDKDGKTLRRFMDVTGGGKVDQYSYFKDGAEVYRESITKAGYNIRWIAAGGMKSGLAQQTPAGKIRIATWQMISAEEAAFEAFQALVTGDADRLQAVLITPQEIAALGLPAAEAQKLVAQVQAAPAKLAQVRAKIADIATAKYGRLENAQPGAYPTDVTGATSEQIKITSGLILFENPGTKKPNDFIGAPVMIQVGLAWRLTDSPSPEQTDPNPGTDAYRVALEKLADFEKTSQGTTKAAKVEWNLTRVKLVTEVAKHAATDRESWYKQVVDGLATATSLGDGDSVATLGKWRESFEKAQPGGNLAAYARYREIWATYQLAVSDPKISGNPKEFAKVQALYHENLGKFVMGYTKAEDAPDALIQLAMGAEFDAKDEEAKKYYQQIAENFPGHANRPKADGAIRRLDAVGKGFALTSPILGNPAANFTMKDVVGKVTVVYYWSTLSSQSSSDFNSLKKLQDAFPKELAVVCVNLDDGGSADALAFAEKNGKFATHLHQPGGMNGPLATQYGIFGLPQLFLVDATGKVVSNKIQIAMLEDEIAKLTKK